MAVSPDGSKVVVTGNSTGIYYPDSSKGTDYATVAYNATTGAQLWVKRYNGPAKDHDVARSVTVGPASSVVYVTGVSTGINTDSGTPHPRRPGKDGHSSTLFATSDMPRDCRQPSRLETTPTIYPATIAPQPCQIR